MLIFLTSARARSSVSCRQTKSRQHYVERPGSNPDPGALQTATVSPFFDKHDLNEWMKLMGTDGVRHGLHMSCYCFMDPEP